MASSPWISFIQCKRNHKKGEYIDGHEREDVAAHQREYLDDLKDHQESHLPPPPPSDEYPSTSPPDAETRKKLVLIYPDESIFNTHKGQLGFGGLEMRHLSSSKPKVKGLCVRLSTNTVDSSV